MHVPAVITIDGPAASGKSTLGELLARRLGYVYFDTGVLYRALTLLALRRALPLDNPQALAMLARTVELAVLPPSIEDGRHYTVLADGEDITWSLRDTMVDRNVSYVSGYPEVRTALRDQQRAIGLRGNVVMVGRDIGTVVMPDADCKLFLDAPLDERARRRHAELSSRGQELLPEVVLEDLRRRDALDQRNTLIPEDAIVLRTTSLTPDEAIAYLIEVWKQRCVVGDLSIAHFEPPPAR